MKNGNSSQKNMKTKPQARRMPQPGVILTRTLLVAGIFLSATVALTQITPPVLTVAPTGTNSLVVTVSNWDGVSSYELWKTPVLGDTANYPWTLVRAGTNSETNFTVQIGPYDTSFFRAVVDTNAIPLWEAADPNNPGAGILTVFIDTPTNGATLQ